MLERSGSIASLTKALASAQKEFPLVPKHGFNPAFKSKHAKLDDVLPAVIPVLSKYGLSISQSHISEGELHGVSTTLFHESGEWISSSASMRPEKPTAQGVGSVVTYFRRYGLSAILGIATEEDQDGNLPNEMPKATVRPSNQVSAPAGVPMEQRINTGTDEQKKILGEHFKTRKVTDKTLMTTIHETAISLGNIKVGDLGYFVAASLENIPFGGK